MSFLLLLRAALPMQINKNDMQSALRFLEKEMTFFPPPLFIIFLQEETGAEKEEKTSFSERVQSWRSKNGQSNQVCGLLDWRWGEKEGHHFPFRWQ